MRYPPKNQSSLYTQRPLNALEQVFVTSNVRFALLVTVRNCQKNKEEEEEKEKERSKSTSTNTSLLQELQSSVQRAIESCRLGYLSLEKDPTGEWSFYETRDPVASIEIIQDETSSDDGRSWTWTDQPHLWLESTMQQENAPSAMGPLSIRIYHHSQHSSGKDDNQIGVALLVNGNHAMVDGRSLTHFVAMAIANQESTVRYGDEKNTWGTHENTRLERLDSKVFAH